jgi:hypothetical protein
MSQVEQRIEPFLSGMDTMRVARLLAPRMRP